MAVTRQFTVHQARLQTIGPDSGAGALHEQQTGDVQGDDGAGDYAG